VADFLRVTADLRPQVSLTAADTWKVELVIAAVPTLQFGAVTGAILAALGAAAFLILAPIPFIGPFLGAAVAGLLAVIGIAGVTGLLGVILTPFVAGLRFTLTEQPRRLPVLPAAGLLDPEVAITLDTVSVVIDGSGGEDELVLSVDLSPA
jgi:hypothetical protein